MEVELKNIIEKIKTEGVEEAEKKASDIVAEANQKAKDILDKAKSNQDQMLKKAKEDAKKLQDQAEEAIRQASRDVILGLRDSIVNLFDRVIKEKIAEQLNVEAINQMLLVLVDKFKKEGDTSLEILVSDKDKKELEGVFLKSLLDKMKQGVELKASPNIENGFRIGTKGSNSYYDFTDEAIEESFKAYLNKKLIEILTPGADSDK